MERNKKGQFIKGNATWNKNCGDALGTIKIINFPNGKRRMIKVHRGTNHNYRIYARWLMEKKLGRKLKSSELVHHINKDKLDDGIKNLRLETRSTHLSLHNKGVVPIKGIEASQEAYKKRRTKWKKQIMELYQEGMSIRKITKIIPLHRGTITKIIKGE